VEALEATKQTSTSAAKHPPRVSEQQQWSSISIEEQHDGKASAKVNDHQRGKASADKGPSRSRQQSFCLRGETEATPAAKQPPEQPDDKAYVQE
jgi:hypothetical protein